MGSKAPKLIEGIRSEVLLVTPAVALKWLQTSRKNRDIVAGHVAGLAAAMRLKEWQIADSISFDVDGALVDGHHRLWAVVESGESISFLVNFGLPVTAQAVMDRGIARTVSDDLTLSGEPNAKIFLMCLRGALGILFGRNIALKTEMQVAIALGIFGAERVRATVEIFCTNTTSIPRGIRIGPVMGAVTFAARGEPILTARVARGLCEGVDLAADSPVLQLRNALTSTGRNLGTSLILSRKVLRVLYAVRMGEPATRGLTESDKAVEFFARAYEGDENVARLRKAHAGGRLPQMSAAESVAAAKKIQDGGGGDESGGTTAA